MDEALQQLTLPAGTVVKVRGVPFKLVNDAAVDGRESNLQLALSHSDTSFGSPYQAMAEPVTSTVKMRDEASQ